MSPTFRALRNPNYRLYVAGTLVSNTGTWMQRVAQDWLVLTLGGGGTALGITTGLQFLPVLLLSPYAGVIADRFPKRRLLQVTQGTMALASLLLGVLAVTEVAQTWHVYVIAFVFGIGSAFDAPARQSFVSEMVDRDELTNAVGLNSASLQPRPDHRPGARRPADPRVRRRYVGHRLGDPGQRRVLPGDHRPAPADEPRPARTRPPPPDDGRERCSKGCATSAASRGW